MKLLGLIFCAGLLLLGSAAPAHADEASKAKKVEQMLQLTHVDQLMDQMMSQMQPMMEEIQKRMVDLMKSRMSWEKLKPIYVKLYNELLTEDEIDASIAFYGTPAGQSLIKKMPLLMQKSVSLMQELMGDIIPEFAKIGEEVAKKYQK